MLKVRMNDEYKDVESVYTGNTPIDTIYSKDGSVVFSANREIEGILPLTFKGYGKDLKNYRIYGNTVNGESVGDLIESGEHSGEYVVPVKIEGKNLLQNTATSQTINGVTFTVNNDKSVTCNGTATGTAAITINTIFSINSTKISGCPMGGSWSSFELDLLNINTNNVDVMDTGNGAVIQNENSYRVRIRIASGYTCDNLIFYPMIRKADISDDTYEPYQTTVMTNIYLPEQIKMVGDEAEYVDYKEQKRHKVRKNLIDFNWLWDYEQHVPTGVVGNFFHYIELVLNPNTTYNVSSDYPYSFDSNTTAFIVVNSETEINTNNGGVFGSRSVTTAQDGILKIARRIFGNNSAMIPNRSELELEEKYIQVEKGSIATEYEPYIEDTDVDVTLPTLPTLSGTNTLTMGTAVQPSKVEITGKIKQIP